MAHPTAYNAVFTFGKHKGLSLGYVRDTDKGYLSWLAEANIPGPWSLAARRCLADQPVDDLALPRLRTPSGASTRLIRPQYVGIILKDKTTAAVQFPYNAEWVARLKSEVDGRIWNGDAKCWEFPIVHLPKVVKIFGGPDAIRMTPEARDRLTAELQRRVDLDEIRIKTDTPLEIPGLRKSLYPYQRVGVEFCDRAGGRAMIADACGLGKTVQAIAFALLKQCRTLIVCPKSVTEQWAEEIEKFTGQRSTIWTTQEQKPHHGQFLILNYDGVAKLLPKLLKQKFDLLVCDEATALKNRRTIRAKALLGSWKERKQYPGVKTQYLLFLTATPVLNRPIEAYYLLNVLDSERFKNFMHFVQRYGGWKMEEPRNLEELHDRTKDIVIRRRKKDVNSELPEKRRDDLVILLEPVEQKEYHDLLTDLFKQWKFNGTATVSTMPKIQGFLTEKKLARVKELIDELLTDDRSILVYSIYIDPLRALVKHYGSKAELLDADVSAKERRAMVKRIGSGQTKIGCFGLKSGGMGLDGLQESVDTVIFLNMDWVPSNHEQAEDRAHRHGQQRKVQVYYCVCEGTIDEDMREVLNEKQKVIDTVVDGQLITKARDQSYFKEFVRRISKKYKGVGDIDIFDP